MTRFGFQIPNFTFDVPDSELFGKVVELARTAEGAGFDSVWVMDHLYQLPPLGGPDRPMLEAYTTLGALAASTSTIKLGALVTGVTYRNPALLAKIVTTLDVISRGRAILGLGAAWYDVEHEGLGFDFPSDRERLDRLEEAVQICRAMFTEDAPTFDGKHYRIHGARNVPRPIQADGIPIMIGGGGEKRTLRLVAQYADMCNFFGDAAMTRHKLDTLRRHCAEVGRNYEEITPSRLATMVLTQSEEQSAQMREMLENAAGRQSATGFNVGTEKEIIAQIEELIDAGMQYFIFNMPLSDASVVRRVGEMLTERFA
jgi:F420-dependent oxidoreductase-like protein